jgi:uracil-DNA glycosylase family 4
LSIEAGHRAMSLDLDPRQRAMLAEMKVPVWWPKAAPMAMLHAPDLMDGATAIDDQALHASVAAPDQVSRPAAPAPRAEAPDNWQAPAAMARAPASTPTSDIDRMDWAQLAQTVAHCTACGLCEGRTAPVFVAEPAPVQADWLIVGEPPDEDEERAGTPFAGEAGQLLNNMLRAVQCTRGGAGSAGARLTSVVKCRTTPVRNPGADELAQCAVYLRREIVLTRPRVIVAMGRFSAMALLAQDYPELLQLPFGRLRGKIYHWMGIPVVVTYHPSTLLRTPVQKANAWLDLCLARAQTTTAPPSP